MDPNNRDVHSAGLSIIAKESNMVEIPSEIKKLARKHKVDWKNYDTFYNLLYDLAQFDPDLCGYHLEHSKDFNIQEYLYKPWLC